MSSDGDTVPDPDRSRCGQYATITASYWAFTLTDGALRMLVLFHLHTLGFAPIAVVSMFLCYEFFGVVTNFVGGYLGARCGLKLTLVIGLTLQVCACALLGAFAEALSVSVLVLAQSASGVAKDLTKMSAKSYIKHVVPPGEDLDGSRLLRWVALLTGSKNALKGIGFFMGGAMLQGLGFCGANMAMVVVLVCALTAALVLLPRAPAAAPRTVRLRDVVVRDVRIRWLSAARLFLFGSRDVWFVLALPVYLTATLEWSYAEASAFLAAWVIGYGAVQAFAPRWFIRRPRLAARRLTAWSLALVVPLGAIVGSFALAGDGGVDAPAVALILGLGVFGAVFAVNSAVHSYLIVHYAEEDRVALGVGFYYAANALGRFLGTLLSGVVFQMAAASGGGEAGLIACVLTAMLLVVLSAACGRPLRHADSTARA